MTLTLEEIDRLVMGLDLLARNQKDVLAAAAELLPLREKLNLEAKRLKEESDGPKP
jgi:hypothetical protein